ncbi:MAG: Wzz/FepE/Etk N-terminal domain-containing protein, partial [Candidatus Sericytochromatia bacterium]
MDLKFYLGVFLRRWWIIVLMTGLVAGFSYYRISQLPTTWSAQARLLYEPNNVANSVLGSTGISFPMSWTNPVTTQLQLVKTRPNVEEVIKRLDLKDGTGNLMDPGR